MLHQIGVGALGPVFRTYEPTRDRLVAVKVFRLDITPEQAKELADELARAADSGLFHASIVEPIAAGVEGTVAYRAEEYVAGESLDVAIRHYAPAPLDTALPFLTQLADAIDFARAAGVGHGALHLRDIFVTPDEARASGFGIVEALERVGLRAPVRRPYSAPERIAGTAWSTPADVFSLAAMAYELLTGRRPSGTGEHIGVMSDVALGDRAEAVRAVLVRAMADDPAHRHPGALAFTAALEAAGRPGSTAESVAVPGAASTPADAEPEPEPPLARQAEPEPSLLPADVDRAPALSADTDQLHAETIPSAATLPYPDEPVGKYVEDVSPERDDDEAHDTLLGSETREQRASLAPEPQSDEFAVDAAAAAAERDAIGHWPRKDEYADYSRQRDVPPPEEELPRVVERRGGGWAMLVVGLVLGAAAGYLVWGRAASAPSQPPTVAATGAPSPRTGQPGARWSEQAVAQPPAGAPPVRGDVPPASAARSAPPPAPASGQLVVRSTPTGAAVIVNDQWKGRTPLTLPSLKFGKYAVRIVQPGFAAAREELTLSQADPVRTLTVRLQPSSVAQPPQKPSEGARPSAAPRPATVPGSLGSIYVDSRPRGATVILDGRPMGTTPTRIPAVAIGSRVVRLELADYRTWTAIIRVAAGEETRVTGSLEHIR